MSWFYFISLLAVACCDLIIDIDIDITNDKATIDVRGKVLAKDISAIERKTFGIEDAQLKKAVENYTDDGTKPDYVYVKARKDNDLYAKFNWMKVKRHVTPTYLDIQPKVNCKIVGMTRTNLEISTDWILRGNLTVTDNIKHIVYFDGNHENKNLGMDSEWGKNKSQQIPVKKEPGYEYKECVLKIEIEYEGTVAGDVVADYTKKRTTKEGGHHFWAYDLENIQNAAKLKKSIITTEKISVTYYK